MCVRASEIEREEVSWQDSGGGLYLEEAGLLVDGVPDVHQVLEVEVEVRDVQRLRGGECVCVREKKRVCVCECECVGACV